MLSLKKSIIKALIQILKIININEQMSWNIPIREENHGEDIHDEARSDKVLQR